MSVKDIEYKFGIQVNQNDIFFFVIDNGANTYFSIVELYELLKKICDSGNEDVVFEALHKIKDTAMHKIEDPVHPLAETWENRGEFQYRKKHII